MDTLKCPKCGQEFPDNSNFCPECGCKIKEEKKESKKTLLIILIILGIAAAVILALYLTDNLGSSDSDEDEDEDDTEEVETDTRDESRHNETIDYSSRDNAETEPAAQAEPEVEVSNSPQAGEYLYNLDSYEITDDDLIGMTKEKLRFLRNYIYAWHGYIFKSKDLQEVFGQMTWYNGRISNVNDIRLNKIEQRNVAKIQQYEKR